MSNDAKKLIVITGVTRGLGRAMADEFSRLGMIVAGCGRSRVCIDELCQAFGKPHDFQVVDVSADAQVQLWSQSVLSSHGTPDMVLNNAALINHSAALWKISAEEFSDVIDVNIKGTTNVIRHFVPAMIKIRRGVLVNFSSGWGRSTDAEVAPYCATKWAIEGLTQALAQELPDGLSAVALNPGIINTEMLQSCFGKASAAGYPTPNQWAKRAVPYILSLGRKHNGQSLTVPGT